MHGARSPSGSLGRRLLPLLASSCLLRRVRASAGLPRASFGARMVRADGGRARRIHCQCRLVGDMAHLAVGAPGSPNRGAGPASVPNLGH